MKATVTYVEMRALSDLVPAAPVPGLTLGPVDRASPLVPGIMARIGAAHALPNYHRQGFRTFKTEQFQPG